MTKKRAHGSAIVVSAKGSFADASRIVDRNLMILWKVTGSDSATTGRRRTASKKKHKIAA